MDHFQDWDNETVAAGVTAQVMGPGTATTKTPGTQFFRRLILIPGNLNPGLCAIKDGSATAITVFTGGANSVNELRPIVIELGMINRTGSWQVTTGADMTAIAVGRFT